MVMDMVQDWMDENWRESLLGGGIGHGDEELSISEIATYQPYDGLMELKLVSNAFE